MIGQVYNDDEECIMIGVESNPWENLLEINAEKMNIWKYIEHYPKEVKLTKRSLPSVYLSTNRLILEQLLYITDWCTNHLTMNSPDWFWSQRMVCSAKVKRPRLHNPFGSYCWWSGWCSEEHTFCDIEICHCLMFWNNKPWGFLYFTMVEILM